MLSTIFLFASIRILLFSLLFMAGVGTIWIGWLLWSADDNSGSKDRVLKAIQFLSSVGFISAIRKIGVPANLQDPCQVARDRKLRVRNFFNNFTMPSNLREVGSIGLNVSLAAHRRQASPRRRRASMPAKSGGSDDGDGGGSDPDPERPQQLFSYGSLSQLIDCSVKTLRNKVCAGALPHPIQTIAGPRFTLAQVQQILAGTTTPAPEAPRPRGRPRIAGQGKGGAA